jgi:cysteamine dioxygenase
MFRRLFGNKFIKVSPSSLDLKIMTLVRSYKSIKLNYNKDNYIQRIYDSLIDVGESNNMNMLINNPLSSSSLVKCLELMKFVSVTDIGLDDIDLDNIEDKLCLNIADTNLFQICVFIIPKGHYLPLHDHPNMCVLTSVISGELKVRSFSKSEIETINIINTNTINNNIPVILSKDCINNNTNDSWFLTPNDSNIHEFACFGDQTCIILDILLPPYNNSDRNINYYHVMKSSLNSDLNKNNSNNLNDNLYKIDNEDELDLPYNVEYFGYKPT